jgi:hypothetical protein
LGRESETAEGVGRGGGPSLLRNADPYP